MESRNSSSLGRSLSSAIFNCSLGRFRLISQVTNRASGSCNTASKAGRKNGSNRRSNWRSLVDTLAIRFSKAEPVFARGIGRSTFNRTSGCETFPPSGMTEKWDSAASREFEREMNQLLLAPIDDPEENPRRDFADLVPDPFRDQRCLGIIENDARLLVEPAVRLVDLRDDRLVAERQDFVFQRSRDRIEHFSLPGKEGNKPRDVVGNVRARLDDGGAFAFAFRDLTRGTLAKEIVELFVGHVEELGRISNGAGVGVWHRLGVWFGFVVI